jgi:hypothetical protein
MVAESLGKALNQNGFEISVSHRDVKK